MENRARWPLLSHDVALPLVIVLAVLATFAGALGNGWVEWDDNINFLENPNYRGFGWSEIRWMLTVTTGPHWIPLTWVTLALDYVVWGMNPLGYHLTSLLLHAANGVLLYLVALRLLGLGAPQAGRTALSVGAAAAALFWALHPLRAESVAWVTERRDVLSGLFYLATVLLYLRMCAAEGAERRRWLAASLACYALALLSKFLVITLPFVLLVLDAYPLRRFSRATVREKVPYLLLAAAGAAIALWAARANVPLTPVESHPPIARAAMTVYSLAFYLRKTVIPTDLSPVYELPAEVHLSDLPFLASTVGVALLTLAFLLLRRRWPAGLAVWVAYGVTLAPASGIVHGGPQLVADRYSYLSCLGWALLAGAAVCAVVSPGASGARVRRWSPLAVAVLALWIVALGFLTWHQVQVWRDTEALWRQAIDVDPACGLCHNRLGAFLGDRGALVPALDHFEKAIQARPDRIRYHGNMGLALLRLNRPAEAIPHLRRVLERYPADVEMRSRLGAALILEKRLDEARAELDEAIRLDPTHAEALTNLGVALTALDRPAEAVPPFERAIAANPELPLARFGLARAYRLLGRTAAAEEQAAIGTRLLSRPASGAPR
ncbi:MAG: tetratricopeptide repeat protein [Candidatus Rokubacteria bacterium]|nr:tetratricopeptide repeat protein [Candidatus Rokubacteria bacterium]